MVFSLPRPLSRNTNTFRNSFSHLLLLQLLLQRRKVPIHRSPRKLLPCDHRILLQRALYFTIPTWLVEIRNAVSLAIVIIRLRRRLNAVERTLEAIIAPAHQQIANVADDGVAGGVGVHFRPGVAVAEGGADFSAGTDLEARLSGFLEKQR